MYGYEVPGGALNVKSTNYPDHGRQGDLPLQGKIPWQNRESNPGPHDQSETLTTRPRGWSDRVLLEVRYSYGITMNCTVFWNVMVYGLAKCTHV
jgi:hypothetical protein